VGDLEHMQCIPSGLQTLPPITFIRSKGSMCLGFQAQPVVLVQYICLSPEGVVCLT
jgi:hypothetical protein